MRTLLVLAYWLQSGLCPPGPALKRWGTRLQGFLKLELELWANQHLQLPGQQLCMSPGLSHTKMQSCSPLDLCLLHLWLQQASGCPAATVPPCFSDSVLPPCQPVVRPSHSKPSHLVDALSLPTRHSSRANASCQYSSHEQGSSRQHHPLPLWLDPLSPQVHNLGGISETPTQGQYSKILN